MKMKTTVRNHLTPIRRVKKTSEKTEITTVARLWRNWGLYTLSVTCNMVQSLWKLVLQIIKNVKLPSSPANSIPKYISKRKEKCIQTKTGTWGQPSGTGVKFTPFTLAALGLLVQVPGVDLCPLYHLSSYAVTGTPHIK